jgi:hypothetical protein
MVLAQLGGNRVHKENPYNRNNSEQSPAPSIYDPRKVSKIMDEWELKRKPSPSEAFRLARFLTTKHCLVGRRRQLSFTDRMVLLEALEVLRTKKSEQMLLQRSREWSALKIALDITLFSLDREFSQSEERAIRYLISIDHFLDPHTFFGWQGFGLVEMFIRKKVPPRTQRLPPKRFIGVGYRDTGTCRNVAEDGTPRWQEVASKQLVSTAQLIRDLAKGWTTDLTVRYTPREWKDRSSTESVFL